MRNTHPTSSASNHSPQRTVRLQTLKEGLLLVLAQKANREPDVLRWWAEVFDLLAKHPRGINMLQEVAKAKRIPCDDIVNLHQALTEIHFTFG